MLCPVRTRLLWNGSCRALAAQSRAQLQRDNRVVRCWTRSEWIRLLRLAGNARECRVLVEREVFPEPSEHARRFPEAGGVGVTGSSCWGILGELRSIAADVVPASLVGDLEVETRIKVELAHQACRHEVVIAEVVIKAGAANAEKLRGRTRSRSV